MRSALLAGRFRESNRMAGGQVVRAAVVVVLMVALGACGANGGGNQKDVGPVQKGGTLTIGSSAEPLSLDPGKSETAPPAERPLLLAFQRLVEASPTSNDVVPGLARSWEFNGAKTQLTFHLGEFKFFNGDTVTADDVKFSLDRMMDPKVDPDFGATYQRQIKKVTAPDPATVVLDLQPGPQPDILDWLTFTGASIYSEKVFNQLGAKQFGNAPTGAGSGPFNIESFDRGQSIVLKQNPNWTGQKPNVDEVVIRTIPNDNARMLALRSGEIDVAESVPYPQIRSVAAASGVQIQEVKIASVFAPWIASSGPTAPKEVRQALLDAIPFDTIQKVAFAGKGTIPNSTVPPLRYWDSSVPAVKTDLAKAKELMASSPTPNGFTLEMLTLTGDTVSNQTAQILQQAWKQIGVTLKIRSLDQASLYQANIDGNWQAILFGPGSMASHVPTEAEFYDNWANPDIAKYFKYNNPQLDDLMKQANSTWDEAKRKELYAKIQQSTLDNLPWLPILFDSSVYAVRDTVHKFGVTPLDTWNLLDTWVSSK